MGRSTVYNKVVTPELWDKVNANNKELLNDFIEYKESSDKSKGTIYQYLNGLKLFFVWNLQENDNKNFYDIKKRDLIKFSNYMIKTLNSSPKRRSFVKSSISSLSNYIEDILSDEDERYEDFKNITSAIVITGNEAVRTKTIITPEEAQNCLDLMVNDNQIQIACFFALAMYSGARKQELLRFKINYFDEDNIVYDMLYETPELVKTKGRGSGGKMLHKYTFIEFKKYYDLWMDERKKNGFESDFLFIKTTKGECKQATVAMANGWATTISNRYLNAPFYFHSLRHFWTTTSIKKGIPLNLVQQLQGWSNADMLELYNDTSLKDTMKDYFKNNEIKDI